VDDDYRPVSRFSFRRPAAQDAALREERAASNRITPGYYVRRDNAGIEMTMRDIMARGSRMNAARLWHAAGDPVMSQIFGRIMVEGMEMMMDNARNRFSQ
jgi:hypothetical protein